MKPKLGFAGLGWIGRNRMDALAASGVAEIAALTDPAEAAVAGASAAYPNADVAADFNDMLHMQLDGIVIATPSAAHAAQTIAALSAGLPVFCQKPLGRNLAETNLAIEAARSADRLLAVDFSYRHTAGMRAVKALVDSGRLGEIRAMEAVFHNAYGPDKQWFYRRADSGGGCLLDLGVHLVDLALWCSGFPGIRSARAVFHHGGGGDPVEDHATALVELDGGIALQLACSWHAPAGCDADIRLRIFGSGGGACFHNINGSFLDFTAESFGNDGSRETLAAPPDDWSGRAAVAWARQLAESKSYDAAIESAANTAQVLDLLYQS